ncbi:MAG: glycoside hydrolase [Spirochaetaceae bacterium]|nr:glycoside hydrolase [Spirochaetaceae bacterium]
MSGKQFLEWTLESAGTGGYSMYRVPGIVVTASGRVLAYYDARNVDEARQDLIVRASEDGQVWEERRILVPGRRGETTHNAVMIAESRSKAVHFFYNVNHAKCYYMKSPDDGRSWGKVQDITLVFEGFRGEYPWNVFSVGPGHGIELADGSLFLQAWLSCGGDTHRPSVVAGILSEDSGETWRRCGIVRDSASFVNPNEAASCELSDGRILLNIRHDTPLRRRAVVISTDRGARWSGPRFELALPDPVCAAGIVRVDGVLGGSGVFAFSNCAWDDLPGLKSYLEGGKRWSDDARRNLTVRLSTDDCETWPYGKHIAEESGYSDLAASPDGTTLYCIYEKGWLDGQCISPRTMAVARFGVDWIKS